MNPIAAILHDTIERCCTEPGAQCPYDDDEVRRITEAIEQHIGAALVVAREEVAGAVALAMADTYRPRIVTDAALGVVRDRLIGGDPR